MVDSSCLRAHPKRGLTLYWRFDFILFLASPERVSPFSDRLSVQEKNFVNPRWYLLVYCGVVMAASSHADDIASSPREQALVADAPPSLLVADRFDQPVQNRLDGYRSTFQRSPSFASALRVPDPRRGDSGYSMRVKATKTNAGFCGYWIHFFDLHALKPTYFDAQAYTHLSFWVRGERGGETFNIRLSDEHWIAKEDSELLGPVDQFLDGGVTQAWREVIVPLRSTNIDCSHFAGLTLEFEKVGEFTVHLEDGLGSNGSRQRCSETTVGTSATNCTVTRSLAMVHKRLVGQHTAMARTI